MKSEYLKNKSLPFFIGLLIYFFIGILVALKTHESYIQISLIVLLALGGFISGKYSGPSGIYGVVILTFFILACYIFMQFFQPDALWIIGLFFLLIVQGFFAGGWLLGAILFKKSTT